MNKNLYRKNTNRSLLTQPMVLATGLAFTGLAGCSPQDASNLPGPQSKETVQYNQPLLGNDGTPVIALPNTVINTYSKVTADVAAGAKSVTVNNAGKTELNVAAGDLIMIIQMQGATMKTDDDPAVYGSITNLNNAGKYELATVSNVTANTISIDGCGGFKNSYTAAGHAQVVRVPQYKSLTVPVTASLTAPNWDGDKGGIVAAYVEGATTLTGGIDVSGTGFRGGATDNATKAPLTGVTTARSTDSTDGAEQGESIAGSQSDYQAGLGKYGLGAPANGGGGGDSHNGGGGGGANGNNAKTWSGAGVMDPNVVGAAAWKIDPEYIKNANQLTDSSGGGRGGYSYGAVNKDALTVPPGDTTWNGDDRRNVGGRGGRPLDNSAADRLFFGGGGGAGDGNNGSAGAGGNGGGLVYLVTGSLTATAPIQANGAPGAPSTVGAGKTGNDAPGGGGGGGTIVVLSGQSINGVSFKADGGLGGNQNITNVDESEGPGGGGGGGYIATYSANYTAVTRTAGGALGGTSNSTAVTEFPSNGSTKGAAGQPDVKLKFTDKMPVCIPSDIAVTAVKSNGTVQGGSTVSLTVTVKNSGPQPSDVTGITDSYNTPVSGVTWTCAATGGAVCPAAAGTGSIAGLASIPASGMLTYVVNVPISNQFPLPNLVYTASAGVSPGFSDPDLTNNSATVTLPMPAADLSLAVTSAPNPATPGQPVTYDLVVTNNGPGTAGSAMLTYTVPSGGVVAGIVPGLGWICQQVASTVTCNYNMQVPPGALPDVKINVVPLVGGMDLVAQASVSGTASTDPDMSNNNVTNTTSVSSAPGSDISVGINSTPNPADQGAAIKYAVRVSNNGPSPAGGASFKLTLPASTGTPTIAAPAGWSCQQVTTDINCVFAGAVPVGTLPEVDVTYQPDATATSVTATVQALGIGVQDSNLANNQATEVTPIGLANAPQADLVLTVTTSPDKPGPNLPLVYTIDVANHGPGTATGAVVDYTVPAGGTIQSIDAPTGWNCSQQDRDVSCWYSGNIDPNTAAPDLHITVLTPQGASSVESQVNVTPKGAIDPNTSDNSVTVTTQLGSYKLVGGGFGAGCSAVPTGAGEPGAALGFLGSLLGLLGLRRRRRS